MDVLYRNSYNALMKNHIMDIMNDNQERTLDMIRQELEKRYDLKLDINYKSTHLNNALALLKKEGKLKSTGHGKYEKQQINIAKEQIKVSGNKEEQSEEYVFIDVREAKKEFSDLMKNHYQDCRRLIQKIDFSNEQTNAMPRETPVH